ncbi:MAG: hypothetical protein HY928_05210 [Elusimicrobia bacterium]|nr:hypothetical protein [Elusimicrobiota bacterium]
MRNLPLLAALLALAAPCRAEGIAALGAVAETSMSAASSADLGAAKMGAGLAMGETGGKGAVSAGRNDVKGNFSAATADLGKGGKPKGFTPKDVPEPKKPGIISRTGAALKPYKEHMLGAGVGGAVGAAAAWAGGLGMLGAVLTGGAIGAAAIYLHKKGETGAAIGAASFGIAGLALGGPIGGLVGAVVGGLGAWMLGKFFAS